MFFCLLINSFNLNLEVKFYPKKIRTYVENQDKQTLFGKNIDYLTYSKLKFEWHLKISDSFFIVFVLFEVLQFNPTREYSSAAFK